MIKKKCYSLQSADILNRTAQFVCFCLGHSTGRLSWWSVVISPIIFLAQGSTIFFYFLLLLISELTDIIRTPHGLSTATWRWLKNVSSTPPWVMYSAWHSTASAHLHSAFSRSIQQLGYRAAQTQPSRWPPTRDAALLVMTSDHGHRRYTAGVCPHWLHKKR